MADIEEANRIRIALGMQPLPTPSSVNNLNFKPSASVSSPDDDTEEPASTLATREAAASENWKKLQDEAAERKHRNARLSALKKERDAAQRFAKLEGKSLGEADGTQLDTKSWLLGSKKRQKKIAKERTQRLAEEIAEREARPEYTDRDLAGMRVGHELGQFDDAAEQVLTLKDAGVEDDVDDELENMGLREQEKLDERLKLKKKLPIYDPNEDDGANSRSILAQYDEEIDGKKQNRFTLDGRGRTTEEASSLETPGSTMPKGVSISLDFLKDDQPASDYLEASEIKVRRPKKKKEKSRKRQRDDEDDDIVSLQINGVDPAFDGTKTDIDNPGQSRVPRSRASDLLNFGDDDDLQSNLTMQRRAALKRRKLDKPQDIARRLREEASVTPMAVDTTDAAEEVGLIIDETSEFVSTLQKPSGVEKTKSVVSAAATEAAGRVEEDPPDNEDEHMRDARDEDELEADLQDQLKQEMPNANPAGLTETGLDDDYTLDKGLGGTLAMLTGRGLLKTAATGDLTAVYRERQQFLAEKQRREADAERKARTQRERDRASGKFDRMSAREREQYAQWENKQRDQQDSRAMAEVFNREYKPNVDLKYLDEFGRYMDQKEAFKHLSHQFHGKGSGKQKTEKRLKKIEDEKKREAASTLDSSQSTGMNNVAGQTARKNRQAGIRLQ